MDHMVKRCFEKETQIRAPGIRVRMFDAKPEKADSASPALSRQGPINENSNVVKRSGVFHCDIKKRRQNHSFTAFFDISDRFLISQADLIWSTHPSIAQSVRSADRSRVGSQISRSCCHILANGRPGEVGLHFTDPTLFTISLPTISFDSPRKAVLDEAQCPEANFPELTRKPSESEHRS
jgi:hypothetical protein